MSTRGMRAPESPVCLPNAISLASRRYIDSSDLPHPPQRLPFLGDVLGLNPRTPFQSSPPQTRKLGPISVRKMLGTEMIAVSGRDLVAEVHDESRFGKYVGNHLVPLRPIIGDGDHRRDRPPELAPGARHPDAGVHSGSHAGLRLRHAGGGPGVVGRVGPRRRQRTEGERHRRHDAVAPGDHRACRLRLPVRSTAAGRIRSSPR